jgi:hypothetical protein
MIPAAPVFQTWTGDGTTTVFNFAQRIYLATELGLYTYTPGTDTVPQKQNSGVTVVVAGDYSGATITFTTAPAVGVKIGALRQTTLSQDINISDTDYVPPSVVEKQLDRQAMMAQEAALFSALAFEADPFNFTTSARANCVWAWDASGNATIGPLVTDVANAETNAAAAAASATAAASSATAAAASQTAAASSASSASTSATNAGNSATAAAGSASTATTDANTASTAATNAGNSATSASSSASTASTAATNAGNSATSASGSASTATTQATNASNSATAAATSATNAANSATAAAASAASAASKVSGPASSVTGHVAIYADTTGKVVSDGGALATVATTGAYSDLSGKPSLATVATTGAYSSLSGLPTLGTISSHAVMAAGDLFKKTAGAALTADGVFGDAALTALTDAATIAVDLKTGVNFTVTLGGNRTLGFPSNPQVGQCGVIYVVQDGTGSRTLAYGSGYKFAGGSAPVLSTAAGTIDRLTYFVRSATHVDIDASLARS